MAVRVDVQGELISWARRRSGISLGDLREKFPKVEEWENEVESPTINQLERFASATHTPIGLFFMSEPPDDELPLPDFRTIGREEIGDPSADLLDTIFECQNRQDWYREHVQATGMDPVDFVGHLNVRIPVMAAAESIRTRFNFEPDQRGNTWSEAFRHLAEAAEEAGVLVMVNGVVGSNTHRKLNPEEFRGFALSDAYAPLVFVNGADTKAAQIFTLCHELAHISINQSALTNPDPAVPPISEIEEWCDRVAGEVMVPIDVLLREFDRGAPIEIEIDRLARTFKASTLVVLRRIYDAGLIRLSLFQVSYVLERRRVLGILRDRTNEGSGGDFYNTQFVRTGRRFAREVISSALEGRTLYRDAMRMLGVRTSATFENMARRLGVQ